MEGDKDKLHYIVATAIIIKDGKYLIAKRSEKEKAFPGLWTVPGGKLRASDYVNTPKDTPDHWYNVLKKLTEREVEEEVDLKIKNIRYLLSLSYIRSDDFPTIILSFYCDWASGKVKLCEDLTDYAWVTAEELKKYEFVPGLQEEIEMVDQTLKGKKVSTWTGRLDDADGASLRDGK